MTNNRTHRISESEDKEFKNLYVTNSRLIEKTLRNLRPSLSEPELEDIISETFLIFLRSKDKLKITSREYAASRNKIAAYCLAISKNILRQRISKEHMHLDYAMPPIDSPMMNDSPRQEELNLFFIDVTRALAELTDRKQLTARDLMIFKEVMIEGKSINEIAKVLNIPSGTAASSLSRTVHKLRKCLKTEEACRT